MSLRAQFIAVFIVFTVALTAVGGWLTWRTARGGVERELDEKLVWVMGAVAEVGFQADLMLNYRDGDEQSEYWDADYQKLGRLQRYVAEAYVFRLENPPEQEFPTPLFFPEGTVLVSTEEPDSLPIGSTLVWLQLYPEEVADAWWRGEATSPRFFGEDGRWYKYGFKRLEQSPAMMAVLARADFHDPLSQFRRTIIIGSLVAAIIAALIAGVLAATVVEPLERLGRVALRIQRGRLDEPVGLEKGWELGRLSRAMERMRKGILQRDEQLRLMLAQVAHEIRNPLGGLELFSAAAAETTDPEERAVVLGKVRSEVVALNQIIDDFLTFARPLDPVLELHDIRLPVREAMDLAMAQMEADGGEATLILPEQPLLAWADPDHVKRVVLNLVRNGAQAGERVEVSAEWSRGEVLISVSDDGPGVDPELRERIFEPFVSDKAQGAGLGLAIVRTVVEANGGRVELAEEDAESGGGAEFHVYFGGAEEMPVEEPSFLSVEPGQPATAEES